jgi:hypothetical protein
MEGNLRKIQAEKEKEGTVRREILRRCFENLIKVFPPERIALLEKETERFLNPLRSQLMDGLEGLLDGLLNGDRGLAERGLALIMSLVAIEDVRPKEALSFILKMRQMLPTKERDIEEILLSAFDIYMMFREKIYELRVKERLSLNGGRIR